jgi:hypothetical protein
LQFYLGKWNFILTCQILSWQAKAKFYFSGLLRLFGWLFARYCIAAEASKKHCVNFARLLHRLLGKFILTGKNQVRFTQLIL